MTTIDSETPNTARRGVIVAPAAALVAVAVLSIASSAAAGYFANAYWELRGDYALALEKAEEIYDEDRAGAVHTLVVEHNFTQAQNSEIKSDMGVLDDRMNEALDDLDDIHDALRKDD